MPKDRTRSVGAHAPSVKLASKRRAVDGGLLDRSKQVEIGGLEGAAGMDVLKSMEQGELRNVTKKKEKVQLKREAFIDKLQSFRSSTSKNQKRRLKKKQKEQVGGGLDAIQAALSALDGDGGDDDDAEQTEQVADESVHSKVRPKLGQIGEGKGVPLTQNQRKRALELERLRAPMILANPDYASNPFQTIRTHAQNTLLKYEYPT